MTDRTRDIIVTLPSNQVESIEAEVGKKGCTLDEFVSEAIERALREERWQETFRYGEAMAKKHGITREDVPRLIEEYRAEKKAAASQ